MNVKFMKPSKDDKIEFFECADCGRYLQRAVIIDGVVYGPDCGARRLGWGETTAARIGQKILRMEIIIAGFRGRMDARAAGKPVSAAVLESDAGAICNAFGLTFSRMDPEFLDKVLAVVS